MRYLLFLLLLSLLTPAWADSDDPGQRALRDLAAWYADPRKPPAYAKTVALLNDADPATRRRAAIYLTALLKQLYEDDEGGASPRRPSPFWGQGATLDAREYRQRVAAELGQNGRSEEALEPAEFLVRTDRTPDVQESAVRVLHRVACQRSSAEAVRLATQPHPNQGVLVTALQIIGERQLKEASPQVLALTRHHRSRVRQEAHKAAKRLALTAPPGASGDELSPDIEQQLKDLEAMLFYPAGGLPASARWVHVKAPVGQLTLDSSWFGREDLREVSGWLLEEKDGQIHLLDAFGCERWLKASVCKLEPRTLHQEVDALRAARAHPQDGLYQQFRPSWLLLPEATTAAWALARGERREAARLILPRLEETPDDRWLKWAGRDLLGHRYHQRMLDAFCYRRDYRKAQSLAHHLAQPLFQGYVYSGRAQELEAQLAARGTDFHSLQLPTPKAWAALRKQLDRPAQIRYLADRLRLLTCRQWGQPGGISFSDEQSDQVGASGAEHYVINPFTTLGEMRLTRADCAALLPYLEDRNYVLGYGFFRDFHPQRTMYRVNELVSELINGVAKKELIQRGQLEREEERKACLARLKAWCQQPTSK